MSNNDSPASRRQIVLRQASQMQTLRPRWAWQDRWPLGEVSLLAGKGGLGKSTICYWAAARITRGELPGEHFGDPRAVLVCATEDSWEYTIVPRLKAAGADLERVFAVDVVEVEDGEEYESWLSLPADIPAVQVAAVEQRAVLLLLDPLVSRLNSSLDTHRDSDVRRALEPLKRLGSATGMSIVGLIHVNKGGGADPLSSVMGSAGFVNVARSVSVVVPDPDDETDRRRLFGTPKNNIGRDDLPTIAYVIEGADVVTDDGLASTGAVTWLGEVEGTIRAAMVSGMDDVGVRTAVTEAGEWLVDYLCQEGGEAPRQDVEKAGRTAGHSIDSLKRARSKRNIEARSEGFPRRTVWVLDLEKHLDAGPATGPQSVQSVQSEQSEQGRRNGSDRAEASQPEQPPGDPAPTAPTAPTGSDLLFSESSLAPTAPVRAPRQSEHDRLDCQVCGTTLTPQRAAAGFITCDTHRHVEGVREP